MVYLYRLVLPFTQNARYSEHGYGIPQCFTTSYTNLVSWHVCSGECMMVRQRWLQKIIQHMFCVVLMGDMERLRMSTYSHHLQQLHRRLCIYEGVFWNTQLNIYTAQKLLVWTLTHSPLRIVILCALLPQHTYRKHWHVYEPLTAMPFMCMPPQPPQPGAWIVRSQPDNNWVVQVYSTPCIQ